MPDPQIDRRCADCGASVRPSAAFCPQCGQPIPSHSTSNDGRKPPDLSETQPLRAVPDIGETLPLQSIQDFAETKSLPALTPTLVNPPPAETNLKPARPTVHRAPAPESKGPVGKLRRASSVVIDQAAYDPSLRFLLVAAVLFLLFLVLLIMSKVMG
jgi:zinc-ribbon domain